MNNAARPDQSQRMRIIVFAGFVVAAVVGFFVLQDRLSIDQLVRQESALREFGDKNFVACLLGLSLLYISVAALSLPFSTVLTVTYGWFFGFWIAFPLVNLSATIGATLSLLTSRYLFHDFVERRYGSYLQRVQEELAKDGALYLLMLRLTPVMPFFIVNPVMGLTKMNARTFFWVSMIGMLPGGALYTLFGHNLPSLADLQKGGWSKAVSPTLIVSFALLGIVPIVIKKLANWLRRS